MNMLLLFISGGASGKEPPCQCSRYKRRGFDPWIGKIPQRRKGQPTPVFLPGEFHGQRSLVGYSPWGHKELDMTERLTHTFFLSKPLASHPWSLSFHLKKPHQNFLCARLTQFLFIQNFLHFSLRSKEFFHSVESSRLGVIFFITLKISSHYFLVSIFAFEKSATILLCLQLISLFSSCLRRFSV